LARAMGPDEDLVKVMPEPLTLVVHEQCAMEETSLYALLASKEK
jgi:hypothetical protein